MAAWSDGYFTEVQYTGRFYAEMAPGFMSFACLRQGVRPPSLGPGATYLELGCGQGFGLNLLAAANPGMSFWGMDFHPGQIANAQRQARAAGLSNIVFEDASFEQMLSFPEGRLPKFDVIALHGVLSWVSPENRAFIVRILERMLKPGGMVYASYNCLPGWAPLVPLQRFIADYVAQTSGDAEVRVVEALRAAQQMVGSAIGHGDSAPMLRQRIEDALKQSPSYLIHEYLNANSHPFFHADVARELDGARLSFAASANIADDLVHLAAPAALQAQIQAAQDRTWRETLLDYASSKPFRRDIFVRGRNRLNGPEREALLDETRFTLLVQPEAASFEFPIPIGKITGAPAVYQPIIEALAEGPRSYGDLRRLPAFVAAPGEVLLQAVTLLVGGRQIHPLATDGDDGQAARAFNHTLLDRIAFDETPAHLACPAAGGGVQVDFADLVAAEALARGETDPKAAADRAWDGMARTGRRLLKNGQVLADKDANVAELAERIIMFNRAKAPFLRRLGVV